MLIRTTFAAAIIAAWPRRRSPARLLASRSFRAAGNAAPILVQDNGAGRGTVSPQKLRKPKAKKAVPPEGRIAGRHALRRRRSSAS